MSKYLDPKADIVFKRVFQEHPLILKSFLNAILPLPEDGQIEHLSILPPEFVPEIPFLKRSIADIQCIDSQNRRFIVEMQIEWVESFKQRLLFESGKAYVRQLYKGVDYKLLQPVYGLGLIAENFDPDPQNWYHHYKLVHTEKPEKTIEDLQLVFIELQKMPVGRYSEKKLRLLWLKFMREIDQGTKEVPEELLEVSEIEEAVALARESAYSEGELMAYDRYWKSVSTEKALFSGKYDAGVAKGLKDGIEKGLKDGIEKGKAATLIAMKTKLKAKGFSDSEIEEMLDLVI